MSQGTIWPNAVDLQYGMHGLGGHNGPSALLAWLMAANLAVEQVVDLAVDLAVSLVVVAVVQWAVAVGVVAVGWGLKSGIQWRG